MRIQTYLAATMLACLTLYTDSFAKEKEPPQPTAWGYVHGPGVDVRAQAARSKPAIVHLGRGTLVSVIAADSKSAGDTVPITFVDPATLTPQVGSIDAAQLEMISIEKFPTDDGLLKLLGGSFLDDLIAPHTSVARFLVRQGKDATALICLIGGSDLPFTQLQVFLPSRGKFVIGPSLQFPTSEMQIGLADTEVRDLIGDGNECFISRELFRFGLESGGANYVIRRIDDGQFRTIWKAPVEFRNLALFPPNPELTQPPEENIGAPGTVTRATVEFREQGKVSCPLWKGKIEIYAFGRTKPVDSVSIEKECPWDGRRFAPLR